MKRTEFWSTAVTKLLSGLHDILDELYGPVETGFCFSLLWFLIVVACVLVM